MSVARGDPGAVAICSDAQGADQVAKAVLGADPSSLVVHVGSDGDRAVVRATGDPDALVEAMRIGADVGLYRTAARPLLRHRRTWPLGEPTPGLTRLYLTRARSGLSADDYHRYWEREHGPRALRHHMGMWDYTQISVIETIAGDPFDGIAVTEWPRPEDLEQRFTDGPIGDAVIAHDAARFTDVETLARYAMDERVLVEGPTTAGTVEVTDARHLTLDCPAGVAWDVIGDFDTMDTWWPEPVRASTASARGVGMTRTLTRSDRPTVVERLVEYRPEERMLLIAIDEGLPPAIAAYMCRYEIRETGPTSCRLDWYPRAVVRTDSVGVFDAVVDGGWEVLSRGLVAAVSN